MLTPDQAQAVKNWITDKVKATGGIKGVDLDLSLCSQFPQLNMQNSLLVIHELVQESLIVRIKYITPEQRSRINEFYISQGSRLV